MNNSAQTHPVRHIFANNVRKIRRYRELSQETLAFEAKVSRVYIGDVERGARAVSIDVMGRIADALKISVASLVSNDCPIE